MRHIPLAVSARPSVLCALPLVRIRRPLILLGLQSFRVYERQRIGVDVQVRVQPALEPDGIALDISPGDRVVIAEVVVY
jgi:hypothetical protein